MDGKFHKIGNITVPKEVFLCSLVTSGMYAISAPAARRCCDGCHTPMLHFEGKGRWVQHSCIANTSQYLEENHTRLGLNGLDDVNTQGDVSNEIILVLKYIAPEYTRGVRIIMRSKHNRAAVASP